MTWHSIPGKVVLGYGGVLLNHIKDYKCLSLLLLEECYILF